MSLSQFIVVFYTSGMIGSLIGSAIFSSMQSFDDLYRALLESMFWPVRAWQKFTHFQHRKIERAIKANHQMLLSECAQHITAATHYMERARIAEEKYKDLLNQFEDLKATQEQLNATQVNLDQKIEHIETESAQHEQASQGTDAGLSERKHT